MNKDFVDFVNCNITNTYGIDWNVVAYNKDFF